MFNEIKFENIKMSMSEMSEFQKEKRK